jgi:hypothetical protein
MKALIITDDAGLSDRVSVIEATKHLFGHIGEFTSGSFVFDPQYVALRRSGSNTDFIRYHGSLKYVRFLKEVLRHYFKLSSGSEEAEVVLAALGNDTDRNSTSSYPTIIRHMGVVDGSTRQQAALLIALGITDERNLEWVDLVASTEEVWAAIELVLRNHDLGQTIDLLEAHRRLNLTGPSTAMFA